MCVVVQRDAAHRASPTTMVVPIAGRVGQAESIISPALAAGEGGLKKPSVVLCNQIRTIDRVRLRKKLGQLATGSLARIELGLMAILDLSSPP